MTSDCHTGPRSRCTGISERVPDKQDSWCMIPHHPASQKMLPAAGELHWSGTKALQLFASEDRIHRRNRTDLSRSVSEAHFSTLLKPTNAAAQLICIHDTSAIFLWHLHQQPRTRQHNFPIYTKSPTDVISKPQILAAHYNLEKDESARRSAISLMPSRLSPRPAEGHPCPAAGSRRRAEHISKGPARQEVPSPATPKGPPPLPPCTPSFRTHC